MPDTNVSMDAALFVTMGEDIVLPTVFSRGPWSLDWLHGGPVAALLARSVERLASDGVDAPQGPADGRPGNRDEDVPVAFHNGGTEHRFVRELGM